MTGVARGIDAVPNCPAGASAVEVLGAHKLIFLEASQVVYEVDDLAAFVWLSLNAELVPEQIVDDLVSTGVARAKAREAVSAVLVQLGELDRAAAFSHAVAAPVASDAAAAPVANERLARMTLMIAGVAVQLQVSKALLADVQAAFGYLATDAQEADVRLCARLDGTAVRFLPPGRPEWSGDRSHFVALLKAELIDSVLQSARYEVALHAAAVAGGHGALLLVGSPGAGKSTLSIALAGAGFEVVSDDVVLVDRDGHATGLPFALTAKAPAWSLISNHWPNLTFEPSYLRPDGQTVAYLNEIPLPQPRSHRIKHIILLDRQDNVPASMAEIDPVHLLKALIEEGATRDERMSTIGFKSLVDVLRQARCSRLTYSDLPAAIDAVRSVHP